MVWLVDDLPVSPPFVEDISTLSFRTTNPGFRVLFFKIINRLRWQRVTNNSSKNKKDSRINRRTNSLFPLIMLSMKEGLDNEN